MVPHSNKHVKKFETMQRTAVKMVPELKNIVYEERLKGIEPPILEERRERGDLSTI